MRRTLIEETMKLYNESDVWKEYIDELIGEEKKTKDKGEVKNESEKSNKRIQRNINKVSEDN